MIYPSKKFAIVLFIILFLGGGWFYFVKFKKPEINQKLLENIAKKAKNSDSDNDGLKDWEEILWKTDINNSDSDKDGFKDGEETAQDFDPLDSSSNPKTGKQKKDETVFAPELQSRDYLNLTQKLAKGMGSNTLMDEAASRALAEFVADLNVGISEKELKISNDNSLSAIQEYNNKLAEIFSKDPYVKTESPDIFAKAIETRNFSVIDKYANYLGQAIIDLKKIAVPSDFTRIHKRITELFMITKKSFEAMKEIENDPLKAVLGIQQGEKANEEMIKIMLEFADLIQKYVK